LPADVREYMDQRVGKEIEKIRALMKEEGFKPAAKPATQADQSTQPATGK
jgi:hypothetical protein